MSFILDALKKAESERNRRVAPVLMDARVAPPRRSWPAWAWALGAVLVVNLGVLAWLLLRDDRPEGSEMQIVGVSAPGANTSPPVAEGVAGSSPAAGAPAPAGGSAAPASNALPAGSAAPAVPAPAPATTAAVAAPQPAIDPTTLPSLGELRAAGVSLPDMELNLHVYDPTPTHRSVWLNGQRLREGEYTPDGVKVERILPASVVLEASGRRFRLDTGG